MTSSEIVSWSAQANRPERRVEPSHRKLVFNGLHLKPNWYRLRVWVDGPAVLVSAKASFFEARRADMRLLLEPSTRHRLEKVFKIAEPVTSLSIGAEGAKAGSQLTRIEITPLSRWAVFMFLFWKGVRYVLRKRHHLNLRESWRHLRAALRPRAHFAFQGRYDSDAGDAAYKRWQAIHEDPIEAALGADLIANRLAGRTVRIALILGSAFDQKASDEVNRSLASVLPAIRVQPVAASTIAVPGAAAAESWDFVLPLDHPGVFAPQAIERLLLKLLDKEDCQAVFADSDRMGGDGKRQEPAFKPPFWDQELLWSRNYIRAPLLLRWNPEIPAVLARWGAMHKPAYPLALMAAARYQPAQLKHVPKVLFHETGPSAANEPQTDAGLLKAHLRRMGHPTAPELIDGIARVAWPLSRKLTVSIIIPSKDNPQFLTTCVNSIRRHASGVAYEIIVVDNGSVRPVTLDYLRRLELDGVATVVPCPGPFNFSRINNEARRHATGEVLLFLNDDTKVMSDGWLAELASLAIRPDVGAVGALLLYPDGSVQHAGVVLGIRGIADHAFRHEDGDARGYLGLLRCRREMTAVTGACLAVSADHFDAVGGFDESLAVTANDIDLCLRMREHGWKTVWTPWAVLEHAESKTRGVDHTDAAIDRQAREALIFTARWGELLKRDPTYNPGLSQVNADYRLAVE